MSDISPKLKNAVPASPQVSVQQTAKQPVPLSHQQRPAPAPFTHAPSYPAGMEPVETMSDVGGIVTEVVSVGGKLLERRFNSATGDGELRPLV